MAQYFNYFPKVFYKSSSESSGVDIVTNITSRYRFENDFKNNTAVYYKYDIRDGDTPEILASKLYKSPEKHWVILEMNNIVDPRFDWPLDQRSIIQFIEAKYVANANTSIGETGLSWAQTNTHSYYKTITRTSSPSGEAYSTTLQIDSGTYANVSLASETVSLGNGNSVIISTTKETKSYYEYELAENEKKRSIKILKPEFVQPLEEELRSAFIRTNF